MAVNMITSGFLLLVLVAGVQSATVELGLACTSSDTCVSPLALLVCDAPPGKTTGLCRVKSGQSCNAAGGLCVVGAECTAGTCTCKSGYSPALPSGQCTVPTGGYYFTCTSNANTVCTKTGLLASAAGDCSSNGGCQCAATGTTVPDYTTGNCIALADSMVGQDCTGDATKCGTNSATHLSCVTTMCVCDAGYFPTKTPGGTCVANSASTVGKTCDPASPTACTGVNEQCALGATKCTCKTGFTAVPGGVCYPNAGTLKGGCSGSSCSGGLMCTSYQSAPSTCKTSVNAGGACSDTTTTVCATGLTCTAAGMCAKTVVQKGGDCSNTATTECATGLICDTNGNTCKTEVDVGGDCSVAGTKCKLHTTCTTGKCVIDATYIGGACTISSGSAFSPGNCQSGTLCGATTSGICVCPSGYEADPAENCAIIAHMYGAPCTATTAATKGDCGDDSLVCSGTTSGTCVCAPVSGYLTYGSNGGVCSKYSANSLGGACTGTGTGSCTDSNAECVGSPTTLCQCKAGFVQSFFTGQCVVKADATTVCTGKTCVEGSTCDATSFHCTCDTGMESIGNSVCLPTALNVLGGQCTITATSSTAKGTCGFDNSKCASGRCRCEDNYTATALAGSCRPNDAMMITTSSLLITLAAVISQLFVR